MALIRIAEDRDTKAILDIYAPFVLQTAVSFEYEVPSVDEFSSRIKKNLHDFPWLVCEDDRSVIAYAYAGKHRDRKAYQWSVETSVYVKEQFHGKGIARKLYDALFDLLKTQGILNAYAGIALPNEKSVRFHYACGFREIGIYRKVGYKLGAWHDVLWMHLSLDNYPSQPSDPVVFHQFRHTDYCKKILEKNTDELNRLSL